MHDVWKKRSLQFLQHIYQPAEHSCRLVEECAGMTLSCRRILSALYALTVVNAVPLTGSYSTWAAHSAIMRSQGNGLDANGAPLVSYEHGELQWALRLLFEKTGNRTYFNYIKEGVDNVVASNGSVGGGYRSVSLHMHSGVELNRISAPSSSSWIPCELDQVSSICEHSMSTV